MKKYNYYLWFSILELIILIICIFGICGKEKLTYAFTNYGVEDENSSGPFFTERIAVPKGIYKVDVYYEKDKGNGICYAQASENDVNVLYTDRVVLSTNKEYRSFDIYVNCDVVDLRFVVEHPENQEFAVNKIEIQTAMNSKIYQILCVFVKLIIINLGIAIIYFRKHNFLWSYEVTGIFIIGFIASLGLLGRYFLYGHDMIFHLFRIEGIKEGILAGQFPVKLQPGWFNGYGYPVSTMYGDTLLYFPAILRLVGVSVQNAYKYYIFGVNIATAAVAYYAFFKMSKNKNIALLGSCVFTLAPYRLTCIYTRAALGEYTAMLFFPLVVLCFWYVIEREEDTPISSEKMIAPLIGFSGLIQTHVLSCFMICFVISILFVIEFKKIFKKNSFWYLIKIAFTTIVINAWFLVPFFSYFSEDIRVVNNKVIMTPNFQKWGADWEELFAVSWNGNTNSSWGEIVSISNKFAKPIGTAFLIVLVIALLLYHKNKLQEHGRRAYVCIGFFVLTVFMSSSAFPYYDISKIIPFIGNLLANIQFPWRFLSMAGLFGSILTVFVMLGISKNYEKQVTLIVIAVIGGVSVMQGASIIYSNMYRGDTCKAYDIAAFESNAVHDGEYLYNGVWGPNTEGVQKPEVKDVVLSYYNKEKLTVTMTCKSNAQNAYVLLPMYAYIGYVAEDVDTREELRLARNEGDSRIKVELPEGYNGTIKVKFREPLTWRCAEIISLMALLVISKNYSKRKRKRLYKQLKNIVAKLQREGKSFIVNQKEIMKEKKKPHDFKGAFKRERIWLIVICGITFVIALYLNIITEYTSDDFKYHFFYDTMGNPHATTHRMRIWEVIASMNNHWQICNGRIVAHGILQLVLMLGKTGFDLINTLMFVVLGIMVYLHATYGKKKSVSLLVLIYIGLWFFLPQFGMTVLWASGAANYLWNAVLILGLLLPYRIYIFSNQTIKDNIFNAVIMGGLGWLAGCTNENSGGASVLLCLFFVVCLWIKKKPIPKWAISGICGGGLGMTILLMAPGNYRISSKTDINGLLERGKNVLRITKEQLGILFIIFCIIMLIYIAIKRKIENDSWMQLPLFYVIAAIASICVLVFSAMQPERTWFIGIVLILVAVSYVYVEILTIPRVMIGIVTMGAIVMFIVSFGQELPKINETYIQVKEGVDLIEEALEKGEKVVSIPMVTPSDSKYDAFNGTSYVKEPAEDWMNAWIAEYYGIEAVEGYQKFE